MAAALRDFAAVVLHALRLLARHWPTLVLLYLLGAAAHNGILWFCIWLSEEHSTLSGFVLPFVPMSSLVALILMLRHLAPSLSHVNHEDAAPANRSRQRLALLASTLIPFLTVYVSQGYLAEDSIAFVNAAVSDELLERAGTGAFNVDRGLIGTGWVLAAIVVGALVARWLLDRFDLPERAVWWGLLAAYVEVLWVWLLAKQFSSFKDAGVTWVMERRFTDGVLDLWQQVTGALGPVGSAARAAASWLVTVVGDADSLIILPIAWLTVAAVVHGRKLERSVVVPTQGATNRWGQRIERVPPVMRRAGREATASLRDRFSALTNGIRLLAVAGLGPMLMFCLIFLLARQVENGVTELARALIGPRDFRDALTISPYVGVLSRGAYTVVLVALLGAAVDRILGNLEGPPADGQVLTDEAATEPGPAVSSV